MSPSRWIALTNAIGFICKRGRYANFEEPKIPIQNWMRNKDVIMYLGLWESINNINFNRVEFDTVRNEAGSNSFRIFKIAEICN